MRIEVRLLRNIAQQSAKTLQIILDISALKKYTAIIRSQSRVMILTVVDLPAPFGPRNPTISPGATLKLTFLIAGMPR